MNISLIIALIGFSSAALGLIAAILGRRREVIHRHVHGQEESTSSFGIVHIIGVAILIIGLLVGLGTLGARYYFPGQEEESSKKTVLFGPINGELHYHPNQGLKEHPAQVSIKDGVIEVTFVNPTDTGLVAWESQVRFRRTYGSEAGSFLLGITNEKGTWYYGQFNEQIVYQHIGGGKIPKDVLIKRLGGRNTMKVVLDGVNGSFFVNGEFQGDLDLSKNVKSGGVSISLDTHTYGKEVIVPFEDYQVYEWD